MVENNLFPVREKPFVVWNQVNITKKPEIIMALFVSVAFTIGFALWFFKTASRLKQNPVQWAIAGAISYQFTAWAWMLVVAKPYVSGLQGTAAKATLSASLIGHSWILVGLVVALLVYKFALLKTAKNV